MIPNHSLNQWCAWTTPKYAAKNNVRGQCEIVQLIFQKDGVRLKCIEENAFMSYDEGLGKVRSMCINES